MNGLEEVAAAGTKSAVHYVALFHVLFALPLLLLAWRKRVHPNMLLIALMCVPWLLSTIVIFKPEAIWLVAVVDVALLVCAVVDLMTLPKRSFFSAERKAMRIASLKKPHEVTLLINNHSTRTFKLVARDDLPEELAPDPEEFEVLLTGRSRSTFTYELTAARRGAFSLHAVHLKVFSKLSLWKRFLSYEAESAIHVYPDMKQLSEYAILARTNRLSMMGVRRTRKVGQDNDFERLRDYTLDDNYKHIDWRSTAKRNKLTVKDFQTSQSQRIIFLVDCGRMMTNESSGISLLDHALNSVLMLSYVALRQGDSVGVVSFSDRIHSYIPPKGGMGQMNQLLHSSFDRFPSLVESRYDQAFTYLGTHCKKRSLVVLITNVIDEVNAHQIRSYLSNIAGHHLPLGVLLRDHQLFDAAENPTAPNVGLYQASAAAEILTWRGQVLTDLTHKGVLALDVFPEDMTAPLVNQYLEVKARHLL